MMQSFQFDGVGFVKEPSKEESGRGGEERLELSSSGTLMAGATMSVAWRDLRYSVPGKRKGCRGPKAESKTIVHGVSGAVLPGEILAIMGGSGAGKSTLLDVLANRKSTGTIEGELLFNGTPASEIGTLLRRVTGYVTQEDVFLATMSVRENLEFFVLTTNDSPIDSAAKRRLVDQVLEDLNLTHVADTRIGQVGQRGLSGGEKKRVAIAEQLLRNPKVLFLDEPTSGLDAYNSQQVLELLHKIAKRGVTIIMSIHQPRSSIYDLFDKLLILHKGNTAYFGPAKDAVGYFAQLGYTMPLGFNPADFLIDVVLSKKSSETDFVDAFSKSDLNKAIMNIVDVSTANVVGLSNADAAPFAVSYWTQFRHVLSRQFKDMVRNPQAAMINIVQAIGLGVIVGSIFYKLGYTLGDLTSRAGLLYFAVLSGAFPITAIAVLIVQNRPVQNRERASGVYHIVVYYLVRTILDGAICIILPVLWGVSVYWMSGLNPLAGPFFIYLGLVILNALVAGSLYTLIGALTTDALAANVMSFLMSVLFMLFAGFLIARIPIWWVWIEYASFLKWSFAGLMMNEFSGYQAGDEFLVLFNQSTAIWQAVVALVCQFVIYRVLGLLAMAYVNTEKR